MNIDLRKQMCVLSNFSTVNSYFQFCNRMPSIIWHKKNKEENWNIHRYIISNWQGWPICWLAQPLDQSVASSHVRINVSSDLSQEVWRENFPTHCTPRCLVARVSGINWGLDFLFKINWWGFQLAGGLIYEVRYAGSCLYKTDDCLSHMLDIAYTKLVSIYFATWKVNTKVPKSNGVFQKLISGGWQLGTLK